MDSRFFEFVNWVDILVLLLAVRIIFVALKGGALAEFFKLCGTVFAIYVSLHYYIAISDSIRVHMGWKKFPVEFFDFLICLFLAAASYGSFIFIRAVVVSLLKTQSQTKPRLNKLGGIVFGLVRMVLLMSLVIFLMTISSITYIKKSVKRSYFGGELFQLSTNTYITIWDGFTSKFMHDEKQNKIVREIHEDFFRRR